MKRILIALTALLAIGVRAQSRDPLVREGATIKVSPHVFVIPDDDVPLVANIGIVVGTRGTLVIDTGLGPRNGETVAREAAKVSRGSELYLAVTHVHPEHDLGASAFREHRGVAIARRGCGHRRIRVAFAEFAKQSPVRAEL
jgi:glyoxylase-like metal-dependent hydrolase (beta-lactamase superfamily II)